MSIVGMGALGTVDLGTTWVTVAGGFTSWLARDVAICLPNNAIVLSPELGEDS